MMQPVPCLTISGIVISKVKLKGDTNFRQWSLAIEKALRARGKFRFLDGSVPPPVTAEDKEDFEAVDRMLRNWIQSTIEPKVCVNLDFNVSAKALWNALHCRFRPRSFRRQCELKMEICRCKQNGSSISDYFGRLKPLWDEYDLHCDPPCCPCPVSVAYQSQQDREKTYEFIIGLDDDFSYLFHDLMTIDVLPSLADCLELACEAERLQNLSSLGVEPKPESASFASSSSSPAPGST